MHAPFLSRTFRSTRMKGHPTSDPLCFIRILFVVSRVLAEKQQQYFLEADEVSILLRYLDLDLGLSLVWRMSFLTADEFFICQFFQLIIFSALYVFTHNKAGGGI